MSISSTPAFPVAACRSGVFHVPGMTYREWLIGMALGISGCVYDSTHDRVEHAIKIADEVISQLEQKKGQVGLR